ncbi:hypothetical protein PQE16_gp56 [Arthrobacter phage Reedo]|uniref:Uncharacterized protein n=1 Tax=Arthrobacter phage Reedo TaxID=2910755 RepID=A0AA49GZ66_9CAUD|nr:hypothetical protein PQE16_gp56 [Arthrobacter phage Reedo]UJQ86846.1 hypothetical protein SEA_REEDO_56 [Arthrobacter phage Reedo]
MPKQTRTIEVDTRHVLRSLEEVYAAWNDAGPVPAIHRRAKRRLRSEWPALAGALDQLTAVITDNPEPRP